jgi:hypothetical protein
VQKQLEDAKNTNNNMEAKLRAKQRRLESCEARYGKLAEEINDVYEDVWNVGTLLQSDDALSVIQPDFRPWPKVNEASEASRAFYQVHDRNKAVSQ